MTGIPLLMAMVGSIEEYVVPSTMISPESGFSAPE